MEDRLESELVGTVPPDADPAAAAASHGSFSLVEATLMICIVCVIALGVGMFHAEASREAAMQRSPWNSTGSSPAPERRVEDVRRIVAEDMLTISPADLSGMGLDHAPGTRVEAVGAPLIMDRDTTGSAWGTPRWNVLGRVRIAGSHDAPVALRFVVDQDRDGGLLIERMSADPTGR